MMKHQLGIMTLAVLVVMAFVGVLSTASSPALADGATQISGVAFFDEGGTCDDPEGEGATFALIMTGDLEGCLYTFVETDESSPSGTYRETGTELFVGSWGGETGTFETTYRFEAKYEDVDTLSGEIHGRCQHPIVEGSGTGIFEGVSGIVFFKDDVEAGNFPYGGHLRSIDVKENGSGLVIGTSSDPGGPAGDERFLGEGETGSGVNRSSC